MQRALIKFVTVNKILDNLKLDTLSGKDKYEILKIIRKIKLIVKEFEEFKDDVANRYTSSKEFEDNYKAQNNSEEAKKYIENIKDEINDVLLREATSLKEVDIIPISEDLFIKLIEVNNLSNDDYLNLEEILLDKTEL